MKTLAQLREARSNALERMKELRELRSADDRRFTPEEAQEFDDLSAQVDELDDEIRLKQFDERMAASSARRVSKRYASTGEGDEDDDDEPPARGARGTPSNPRRGPTVFSRKADPEPKFQGEAFVRMQIAKALAFKGHGSIAQIAEERWGKTHKQLVQVIRATVAGMGSGSGEAGAELLALDAMYTGDFIEFLYKKTLFDTLPLKPVPANVRIKGQDGQYTGYWVGESKAIGMSKGDYSSVDLTPLKVAGLAVISMELLEDSSPAAEGLVRDGLVNASAQRVDTTFFSATAASAGVSPAGLLNGVSGIASSGTDLAATRADFQALLGPFVAAQMASGIVLVMNPAQGLALSFMYGALDEPAYPNVNENGGEIGGRKVYTGDNVTSRQVLALRPEDIWRIGDSGIRVSMSTEATIEQRDTDVTGATDTPTGVTTTGLTSMFQEESVAFKIVRRINFQKRRTGAVTFLSGVEWGGVLS